MAYAVDPAAEQAANNPAGANPLTSQPTTSSGAAPAVSKTPTSNVSNQTPGTASPAQPFQNISAYLTANQPQVAQEGQTIAGGLNTKAADTENALSGAKTSFDSSVAAGSPSLGADKLTTLANDPSNFVQNPGDVATFNALYGATPYSGPSGFSNQPTYTDLSAKAADAGKLGTSLKDFNGIQSYLKGLSPSSTAGTSALDTALLQGTPEALTPINAAADRLSAAPGNLQTLTDQENAAASDAAAAVGQNGLAVHGATNAAQKALQDRIAKETADATAAANTSTQSILGDFTAGKATPEDISALGLSPTDYQALMAAITGLSGDYGQKFDLSPYVTGGAPGEDFAPRAASASDYSTVTALQQLLGGDFTAPAGFTDPALAGTAPKNFASLSGTPLADVSGKLAAADKTFLTQPTPVGVWNPENVPADQRATYEAQNKTMADVFSRAEKSGTLSPAQQKWLTDYRNNTFLPYTNPFQR